MVFQSDEAVEVQFVIAPSKPRKILQIVHV